MGTKMTTMSTAPTRPPTVAAKAFRPAFPVSIFAAPKLDNFPGSFWIFDRTVDCVLASAQDNTIHVLPIDVNLLAYQTLLRGTPALSETSWANFAVSNVLLPAPEEDNISKLT